METRIGSGKDRSKRLLEYIVSNYRGAISANDGKNVFNTEACEISEQELGTVSGGGWFLSVRSYIGGLRRGGGVLSTKGRKDCEQ